MPKQRNSTPHAKDDIIFDMKKVLIMVPCGTHMKEKLIDVNPCEKIESPKLKKK